MGVWVPENSAGGSPGRGGTGLGTRLRALGHSLQSPYSLPPLGQRGETETNSVYPLLTEDLLSHSAFAHQRPTKTEKKKYTTLRKALSVKLPPTRGHVKYGWGSNSTHHTLLKLFSSVTPLFTSQFSCSVVSNSLQPHRLYHARPPYPSPTPRVYSNSCPWSR